ncbi:MAG TPA: hypothetical protein VHG90_07975 [Acidimicrobiales bacterium]|nr:hypothetical protein [Acidimicrobiales bacterium]
MTTSNNHRTTAIVGTAFAALFVGAFATGGEPPEETAPAADVIAYYSEHASQLRLTGFVMVAAAVLLLFFAGGLRDALSRNGDDRLSTVAYGGAVAYAVSLGVMVVSALALVAAADLGNADAVTALNVLDNKMFPLFMVGLSATMLATGLRALEVPVLPRWLAWLSTVLGIAAVAGPGGYAAFFAFPFWVVAVGVSLARRQVPSAGTHDSAVLGAAGHDRDARGVR